MQLVRLVAKAPRTLLAGIILGVHLAWTLHETLEPTFVKPDRSVGKARNFNGIAHLWLSGATPDRKIAA
jgi:hypothetical protein